MPLIAIAVAAFAVTFFVFSKRGQRTADCVHKALVAAILAVLATLIVAGFLPGAEAAVPAFAQISHSAA